MNKITGSARTLARIFAKNKAACAALVFLWLVTLVPRVYWLSQKDAFHNDEITSILFSEYNDLGWTQHFQFDKAFSGKQIKESFLLTDGTYKEMFSDIWKLWHTTRDIHFAPFFILFRIAEGTLKTGEIRDLLPRAGGLNLILYSISFFVFFFLVKRLIPGNKILPYIASTATFLSTAAISSSVLFRPYQMQQTFTIIFVYVVIRYLTEDKFILHTNNKLYIKQSFLFAFAASTALALTSVLFSIIFVVVLGLFVIAWCIYTKRYKDIGVYIFSFFVALGASQIIYAGYLGILLGFGLTTAGQVFSKAVSSAAGSSLGGLIEAAPEAASETAKTIFQEQVDKVFSIKPLPAMFEQLYGYYWTLPVIIVTGVIAAAAILLFLLNKKKPKINWKNRVLDAVFSPCTGIVLAAALFILLGIIGAQFKEMRYGAPVYPFFILIPALILNTIKNKKIMTALGCALVISFGVYDFTESKVPNVWHGIPDKLYKFRNEPQIPAFIIADSNHFPLLLPYLADDQIYIFNKQIYPAFQKFNFEEFFLIINDPLIEKNVIDSELWEIEEVYKVGVNIGLWTVGKIKRIASAEAVDRLKNE
ncbi:MAG: hypothetical protein LBC77_05255 [Spirochaetaceae bacterium]|jgi:hypothetical protein|nr:hypothetical protein [Spirochaetaceae bacterium]